jgi:hypothetical protein
MFHSSGVKAEGVQISQSLHQGENSNLSFSLENRERALLRAHFHLQLLSVKAAFWMA